MELRFSPFAKTSERSRGAEVYGIALKEKAKVFLMFYSSSAQEPCRKLTWPPIPLLCRVRGRDRFFAAYEKSRRQDLGSAQPHLVLCQGGRRKERMHPNQRRRIPQPASKKHKIAIRI